MPETRKVSTLAVGHDEADWVRGVAHQLGISTTETINQIIRMVREQGNLKMNVEVRTLDVDLSKVKPATAKPKRPDRQRKK